MKGRKPKPTALRLVEGNREHRPINGNEPKPEPKAPGCPQFLKDEERKAWRYLVREMKRMGTLASSDRGDMTAYCHWWGLVAKAKRKMLDQVTAEDPSPEVITTKAGNLIQNPWLGIANTAAKEITKVSEKLGLDPTARTRLKIEEYEPMSRREKLLS